MAQAQNIAIMLSLQNVGQVINGINAITQAWASQGKAVSKNMNDQINMMGKLADSQAKVALLATASTNKQNLAIMSSTLNISQLIGIIGQLTSAWTKEGVSMTKGRQNVIDMLGKIIQGEEQVAETALVAGNKTQKANQQSAESTEDWKDKVEGLVNAITGTGLATVGLTGIFVAFANNASNSINQVAGHFAYLKTVVAGLGGALGFAAGGPVGAALGFGIGELAGSIAGVIMDIPNKILASIGGLASSLVQKLSSVGSAITSSLINPFTLLGYVAEGTFGDIQFGIQSMATEIGRAAASFQRLRISIETLAKRDIARQMGISPLDVSMEKATETAEGLFSWLRQIALTSPFTMESIARSMKFAAAMGLSVKMTEDLTVATGNFAAAMGISEDHQERIMYNLAQIYQQGKLTGREFRDLAISFVPVYDILGEMAKEANMSTEAFKKLALEGGVPVEDFFVHFINYMNANYPDAMEKMSRTMMGVTNNIADFIQVVLGMEVLGPLLDKISGKLADMLTKLLSPQAHRVAQDWGIGLSTAFDHISYAVENVGSALSELFKVIGIAKPTMESFARLWVTIFLNIKYGINFIAFVIRLVSGVVQQYIKPAIATLGTAQNESGGWGIGLIRNFALGMARAAATFLARVFIYIRALINAFFKGNSPPKVAPNIDKQGGEMIDTWIDGMITEAHWDKLGEVSQMASAAIQGIGVPGYTPPPPGVITPPTTPTNFQNEVDQIVPFVTQEGIELAAAFMHGFDSADFSALDTIQGAISSALDALTGIGALGEGLAPEMFYNFSQDLIAALDQFNETGEISASLMAEIANLGMGLGPELADLVQHEFDLSTAISEAAAAQERLDAANKALGDARVKVHSLVKEYNALLRAGANKATLKNKLAEVNAAEEAVDVAEEEVEAATENKELADERVDQMQEAVDLQEELVNNLIELMNAQADAINDMSGGLGDLSDDLGDLWGGVEPPSTEDLFPTIDWEALIAEMEPQIAAFWSEIQDTFSETFALEMNNVDTETAATNFATKLHDFFTGKDWPTVLGALGDLIGEALKGHVAKALYVLFGFIIGGPAGAILAFVMGTLAEKIIAAISDALTNYSPLELIVKVLTFVNNVSDAIFAAFGMVLFSIADEINDHILTPIKNALDGVSIQDISNALLVFAGNFVLAIFGAIGDALSGESDDSNIGKTIYDKGEEQLEKESNQSIFGTALKTAFKTILNGLIPKAITPYFDENDIGKEIYDKGEKQVSNEANIKIMGDALNTSVKGTLTKVNTTAIPEWFTTNDIGKTVYNKASPQITNPTNVNIAGTAFSNGTKSALSSILTKGIPEWFATHDVGLAYANAMWPQITSFSNTLEYTNMGKYIDTKIADGIHNGTSIIGGMLDHVIDEAIEWALSHLGVSSPAPSFVAMGELFSESIAVGISNGADVIGEALTSTISGVSSDVKLASNISTQAQKAEYLPSYRMNAPSVTKITNVNFGDVYLNNNMDWATFKANVRRATMED